jgi:hypothetical protein
MLVGDPRDIPTNCPRREGHVVRNGDRDLRVRAGQRAITERRRGESSRRGGRGVLDEIDERGGGNGVWKGEADGEGTKERPKEEEMY